MKTISQREARQLRKRVAELEDVQWRQRNSYTTDYPGVLLGGLKWSADEHIASAVYTARRLGHAVVVVAAGSRSFNLYAVPFKDKP